MGDDDGGCTALTDALHHLTLHHRVERTRSLVEDENHRLACQCRGNLKPLSLSAREVATTLYESRVESPGAGYDVVAYAGIDTCHRHGEILDGVIPHLDVLGDGVVEEHHVLVDTCHRVDKLFAGDVMAVAPVEENLSAPRLIEPREEFGNCALSAARGTHDGNALAGVEGHRKITYQRGGTQTISECHVLHLNHST